MLHNHKRNELIVGGKTSTIEGGALPVSFHHGAAENPSIKGIVVTHGSVKEAEKLFKAQKGKGKKTIGFDMVELDILVGVMLTFCLLHALGNGKLSFFIAIGVLALVTEQASVRLGRTHCHKDAIVMVSPCSYSLCTLLSFATSWCFVVFLCIFLSLLYKFCESLL